MNEKHKMFANEYLIDCNATRAYRAVYKSCKSDETASVNASKLLRNTKVKAYLDEKLKEIESARIATAQEVMEYLTSVMRREKKESVVVTLMEETSTYVPDPNGTMRRQTVKKEVPTIVEIPAKLSDANKAAELLAKRYGLLTEKVNLEGAIPIVITGGDRLED